MSFSGEMVFEYFQIQFVDYTGTVNIKVAVEALKGSTGMFLTFVTSTRKGCGLSTSRPGRFTHEQDMWYPLYSRVVGL